VVSGIGTWCRDSGYEQADENVDDPYNFSSLDLSFVIQDYNVNFNNTIACDSLKLVKCVNVIRIYTFKC
jgi:hypothetical protein